MLWHNPLPNCLIMYCAAHRDTNLSEHKYIQDTDYVVKDVESRVAIKTLHAKGNRVISLNRNLQDFYIRTVHIFYLWHMRSICLSFLKCHRIYPAKPLPIRKQTCTWRKDVKAWSGGRGSGSNYRFSLQRLVSPHARKVCAVVLCVVWILCAILGIPKSELLFIFTDQIPS